MFKNEIQHNNNQHKTPKTCVQQHCKTFTIT